VALPALVILKVLRAWLEPILPLTLMVAVLFKVRSAVLALVASSTELRLIGEATPVPIVKVLASAMVVAPKVIAPVEVPPMLVSAVTATGLFKSITPVPAAVIVPATEILDCVVAVTPPVKAVLEPARLLIVKLPVLLKLLAPVMLLLDPVRAIL